MKTISFASIAVIVLIMVSLAAAGGTTRSPGIPQTTPVPTTLPVVHAGESSCGFTTCHGLDLACGTNAPQVCTMMYQLGDKCRQYARCESSGGSCRLVTDPQFDSCKACVEQCAVKAGSNGQAAFACEATC
ncbi:hypothetical protein [uncultured Methanoregula sp.]|uniref:hypothetical protein n=1 Tax=uncultured Methanoregula sp. TaxID=1005933 RepID=UPI002AABB43E|nr:hypothetical protein [uncultured Methanoregula sp.]